MLCALTLTGNLLWSIDLEKAYGIEGTPKARSLLIFILDNVL
jgi:hypothetical protein